MRGRKIQTDNKEKIEVRRGGCEVEITEMNGAKNVRKMSGKNDEGEKDLAGENCWI